MGILLRIILPALLTSALLSAAAFSIYNKGKARAALEWELKVTQIEMQHQKALSAALAEHKRAALKHQQMLMELERKREEANIERDAAVADLAKRGLYVSAPKCPSNHGVSDDGATRATAGGRVRLSSEDEKNLIAIADDAQKVVIQYRECRELLGHARKLLQPQEAK